MNYELAKQLKDAGYPQTKSPITFEKAYTSCVCHLEKIYVPTLEDLIEACLVGDKKMQLNIDLKGCGVWIGNNYSREKFVEGKTPTEAVAKLWLELNK